MVFKIFVTPFHFLYPQLYVPRGTKRPSKISVNTLLLLTHYQTTNFRLFQTERVCRPQFQISQKWQLVIQMGRKHCGKRRNFSFSHSVFKRLVSHGRQKVSLCGNGLISNTVKPGRQATSIQREPPLSMQILVLPIAFTLN